MSMIALSTFLMGAALLGTVAPYPDPVPDLTEVPEIKDDSDSCVCPARSSADVVVKGYVVDAEVTLGADRLSVEDRMATIFDVEYSTDEEFEGRTRIWHHVSQEYCGITFDYGKKYTVNARYDEDGELETDACLMGY